jgi:iron complex outermembrane receptor protein
MHQSEIATSVRRALVAMVATAGLAANAAQAQESATQSPPAASQEAATQPSPATAPASPANSDATNMQTVVVTGTRASIRKSQAIKQDAVGVVDAVSAEDVGKFPDQNIADSLQRVPGVSVDRSGGESRFITVRGFGPEFNTVLMNGRTMATENGGREFSFDVLPSELISSAEVQKTSSARVSEGGIGATVDIRTARPLDNPGFHVAGSFSTQEQSLAGERKPKLTGLISDTNADKTFGFLGAFVYSDQQIRSDNINVGGWVTPKADASTNPLVVGKAIARSLNEVVSEEQRTRLGFNVAVDWLPTDKLSIKFDGMYSAYRIVPHNHEFGLFTDYNDIVALTANEHNTVTSFTRSTGGGLANDSVIYAYPRHASNQLLGVNAAYQFSDHTKGEWDVAYSRAEDNSAGKGYFAVVGVRNTGYSPVFNLNGTGGYPEITGIVSPTDDSNARTHFADREGSDISDQILQTKFDLTTSFDQGVLSRLMFGVSAADRTKTSKRYATPDAIGCAFCGYNASVPTDLVGVFDAGTVLGASGRMPGQWFDFDPNAYFNYLASGAAIDQLALTPEQNAALKALMASNGGYTAVHKPENDWRVEEKSYAAYAEANFEGTFGTKPWLLDVGLRYVKTDVTSSGNVVKLLGLIPPLPGDPTGSLIGVYGPLSTESRDASYNAFLPSLNFRINLTDQLILRASASKTLTRPTLSNLQLAESYSTRPGTYTLNHGNPALLPYKALNGDLSLEWYPNDTSYLALSLFYKKVNNFIQTISRPVDILGFPFIETIPVNANEAVVKGAEFSLQYTFDRLPAPFDGLGTQINYTYVDSKQSLDPAISTDQFAVVGLSDSGNFVLFYEKGKIGVRAAVNWRDRYLASVRGAEGEPESVKPYTQLDLSANYKLNDNVSLFASASNLTGEIVESYQRYEERFKSASDYGRTVSFGIRGSW